MPAMLLRMEKAETFGKRKAKTARLEATPSAAPGCKQKEGEEEERESAQFGRSAATDFERIFSGLTGYTSRCSIFRLAMGEFCGRHSALAAN